MGLPCGLNRETMPLEGEEGLPGSSSPCSGEPHVAVGNIPHVSGSCVKCRGKWTGAGKGHACRLSHSHHYRIQQSRHTMCVIMENGFPFRQGGKGGREGSSREAGASAHALGWAQV